MNLDSTDLKILDLLRLNSKTTWKEIGETIHMTGQSVGYRIRKMEDSGIIKNYTIDINYEKTDKSNVSFVTVYMNSSKHELFRQFVQKEDRVLEAYKISGDGCYMLKVNCQDPKELNELLEKILSHGNFKVSISLDRIK